MCTDLPGSETFKKDGTRSIPGNARKKPSGFVPKPHNHAMFCTARGPRPRQIPLSQLAKVTVEEGPAQISRDNISRRINIEANVRDRDLASFVVDAQQTDAILRGRIKAEHLGDFLTFTTDHQLEVYSCANQRLTLEEAFVSILDGNQ